MFNGTNLTFSSDLDQDHRCLIRMKLYLLTKER